MRTATETIVLRLRLTTILTALLALLCDIRIAFAWPPTFGAEFNFTNTELYSGWRARMSQVPNATETAMALLLSMKVRESCAPDCVITSHPGKFGHTEFKVTFPDGFWFNISVDPAVVEVQTSPATLRQLEQQVDRMQKHIFDPAREIGLGTVPVSRQEMSSHLNIGALSAFEDQPKAFMGFMADYANHPALGLGILGVDTYNAPPVNHLKDFQQNAFQTVINDVNADRLPTVPDISGRIHHEVYRQSPGHRGFMDRISYGVPRHYQGIGLKQLNTGDFPLMDKPMEIRAMRQPETARDYLLQAELIQARMEHIRNKKDPILFIRRKPEIYTAYDAEELAGHFFVFTEETGVDRNRYLSLLLPTVREKLLESRIPAVLQGSLDWTSPSDRRIIQRFLIDDLTISKWGRNRFAELLQQKNLPAHTRTELLESARARARLGPDHAAVMEQWFRGLLDERWFRDAPEAKELIRQYLPELDELKRRPPQKSKCLRDLFLKWFGF